MVRHAPWIIIWPRPTEKIDFKPGVRPVRAQSAFAQSRWMGTDTTSLTLSRHANSRGGGRLLNSGTPSKVQYLSSHPLNIPAVELLMNW